MQDAQSEPIRPWHELADELRRAREMSQDDLAYEARRHGASPALTGSVISQVRQGKRPLHADFLEGIAGALGVAPELFVEYRLLRAREQLDPAKVGLAEAAQNLTRAEAPREGEAEPMTIAEARALVERAGEAEARDRAERAQATREDRR